MERISSECLHELILLLIIYSLLECRWRHDTCYLRVRGTEELYKVWASLVSPKMSLQMLLVAITLSQINLAFICYWLFQTHDATLGCELPRTYTFILFQSVYTAIKTFLEQGFPTTSIALTSYHFRLCLNKIKFH